MTTQHPSSESSADQDGLAKPVQEAAKTNAPGDLKPTLSDIDLDRLVEFFLLLNAWDKQLHSNDEQ